MLSEKLNNKLQQLLNSHIQQGLQREQVQIKTLVQQWPLCVNASTGEEFINWCSNSYLGLHAHQKIINASLFAIQKHGAGATGTRNISGTNPQILELEQKIANYCEKQSSVLFQSAWAANFFVKKLADSFDSLHIFSDEQNHNSLIIPLLASKAKKQNRVHIFKHNSPQDLRLKMQAAPPENPKLILFEDKYSMSGKSAPIEEFEKLADEFEAILFCDVTHSFGLYDNMRRFKNIDILSGTLGKAVGSQGGFIATSPHLAELVKQSDTYIFTTSNSVANVAASSAAIDILNSSEGTEIRAKHKQIVAYTKQKLEGIGISFAKSNNAEIENILPITIGDEFECKKITAELLEKGIYLQPIFYPTVPKGGAMLRVTPSALHTEQMADELVVKLNSILFKKALPRVADRNN